MNAKKYLVGFICIFFVCNFAFAQLDQFGPDDYGKIIGQFIDPATGKPINEVFHVVISETNPENIVYPLMYKIETDENGRFSVEAVARDYYIRFSPTEYESKYACEPYVDYKKRIIAKVISVQKCKVTRVFLKPRYGGRLHFKLVDQDGQLINVPDVFSSKNLFLEVKSEGEFQCPGINIPGDKLFDAETFYGCLLPGKYLAPFSTRAGGIGSETVSGIEVAAGKTTIVPIEFDLTTGISGNVIYNNSTPPTRVWIHARLQASNDSVDVLSKKDGSFRFFNLEEGVYKLDYLTVIDGKEISGEQKGLIIKKNHITHANITLDNEG